MDEDWRYIEIWKDIKDYKGLYWISNQGHVRNKYGRILKPNLRNGYYRVYLKDKWYSVHRLVAEAFIPNPDDLPEVDHIDRNRTNNYATNLRWVTHEMNIANSKPFARAVYCFDLNKTFRSASEASVHTGVCRTSIIKACKNKLNQAGGMLWCYEQDKNKVFP